MKLEFKIQPYRTLAVISAIDGEGSEGRDEFPKNYVQLNPVLNIMTAKLDKELQLDRKIEWHNKIKMNETDLAFLLPSNKAPKI